MIADIPFGFYPFWFWNDRLSADEIRWQIGQMAAQGIRGFFIHPRQGMGQPYLSAAFFEMVDVAVAAAEAHDLSVHLYDEYPYPSGVAGGQVVLGSPRYYATELVQQIHIVEGDRVRLELPPGKVLSVMAYPLNGDQVDWARGIDLRDHVGTVLITDSYRETGLTPYNQKRYFASNPTPVLEAAISPGLHKVFVSVQVEVNHFKYWGHYADVLNKDAMRLLFELTHERYRKRYAAKFGKTILSIFADEIQPGWSDLIPAAFEAEYGYDLCVFLPALQDPRHPDHVRVKYDLYRLQYKLFCDAFERPLAEWCHVNGLAYTGEKPSQRMSQLRFMDIPGCEPGHTKAGAKMDLLQARLRGNAKATASAAYWYGKPGALDECYHSLGWSGTLQDAKLMADGLLLMGIRYLVPHGFFYSTHALKKHDAPPTFFFQMPYWPLFGKLAERVDRIGRYFEGTHIDAQALLIEPSSGIPTPADLDTYVRLQTLLMENHIDFHFVDTDILTEGRIEGNTLHVCDLHIKLVIVPPMQVIEKPLQDWLDEYERAGGHVVRCAREFGADELLRRIHVQVRPGLSVRAEGQEIAAIQVVKRVSGERTLWFVLNTSGETLMAELDGGGELVEIPLQDNQPASLQRVDDKTIRTVYPFESFLLHAGEVPRKVERLPRIIIPLRGPARLRLRNKNLLRMYEWQMSLLDEAGRSALVPAVPICDQLAGGRFKFAPDIKTYFGNAPELSWPRLRVRYEYAFENQSADPVELVMEPGSIVGEWQMQVNECAPFGLKDFGPTDAHLRGSLGKDITSLIRRGRNLIRVELETTRSDGGLLNPLYLAGDFGVELNPVRLVERPDRGGFETYEHNRLPYYAGVIEYEMEFYLEHIPTGPHIVAQFEGDAPFEEASEVSINGSDWQPVLWQPRQLTLHASQLKAGQNALRVRVYTTLIRSFEGQWFDYERHEYRGVLEH